MASASADIPQLIGNNGNKMPAFKLPSASTESTDASGIKAIMHKNTIPVKEDKKENL